MEASSHGNPDSIVESSRFARAAAEGDGPSNPLSTFISSFADAYGTPQPQDCSPSTEAFVNDTQKTQE